MGEINPALFRIEEGSPSARSSGGTRSANYEFLLRLENEGKKKDFLEHVDRILGVARKYLTVHYLGRSAGFGEFANEANQIKAKGAAELSDAESDMLCAIGLYGMARVRLEQVALIVNMEHATSYLWETIRHYNEHLALKDETGCELSSGQPWWSAAPLIPFLRSRIDKHYYRLAQIDGENWNRRELLLDRNSIDQDAVPQTLQKVLMEELADFPLEPGRSFSAYLRRTTHSLIRNEGVPLRLLKAVMRAASEDPITYSDYSTLLFPRGTNLSAPWTTTHEDFAAHVVFRKDFVPPNGRGIGDFAMIQKAMLAHHAAKKARNASTYLAKYGPNAKPSLSDDLGELGVYYHESAHHKGHMICGVCSAMRYLTAIEMETPSGRLRVEGLTDFRLTRISDAVEDRYNIQQFPLFYVYGCWVRTVLEASFESSVIFPRTLSS